jgi:MFS family permease
MTSQDYSRPVKAGKAFFYGYIIILILFIIQMFMFTPRGSFGVFIKPLTDDFGWSRALISGAFALSTMMQGLSSVLMGGLNDRFGPRIVITLCGLLLGAGLLLTSLISSPWQLYLTYALLVGVGMGGLFTPQLSTVARWFVKRRNLMNGLVMAGGGIGGFIAPPLVTSLIYDINWRQTFLVLAIVIAPVMIIASQFLKRDPSARGQVPYGENRKEAPGLTAGPRGLTLKEAMHTPQFFLAGSIVFCFGFILMTVMVHTVPHVTDLGI